MTAAVNDKRTSHEFKAFLVIGLYGLHAERQLP
jgi:hypothetical protein